ncbi:MAG: hypothetical protein ACRDYV_05060 [Acidimicrobiia bacterium]
MRAARPRRTVVVVGALMATGALLGGVVLTQGGGPSGADGSERPTAPDATQVDRFFGVMRLAFTGVLADAGTFDQRAEEVAAGTLPPAQLTAALDASLRRAEGSRDLVGASADLPGVPQARPLYLNAALLYAEALWALRAGVESAGPGRAELVLSARRLKVLSNRVYDRGTVLADPGLPVVRETPDWAREGLLPAAPPSVAAGWGQTLGEFAAGVRARVAPPTSDEPSLARMAVLVDDEAVAAWGAASSATGALRDAHEARARRLSLLGEDLWRAAPDGDRPDHPRSGFDRTGLDPQPVPGLDDGLGS